MVSTQNLSHKLQTWILKEKEWYFSTTINKIELLNMHAYKLNNINRLDDVHK